MSLNILLVPMGSSGDVDPMVGIGRALLARGHRAHMLVNPHFEKEVKGAGLAMTPLGTAEELRETLKRPELWDGRRAFFFIAREAMLPFMRPVHDWIADNYELGRTVVVAGTLAFGARIAHDKLGVPLVTAHFQPASIRTAHETPAGTSLLPRWAPVRLKRWSFRALDWLILDRVLAPGINAYRKELGLPPIKGVFDGWMHSPQGVLAMFPDWYAAPQPDWPTPTRTFGFPLYDNRGVEEVPADLQAFLDAGTPPIIFTFGSAMRHAAGLFAESVAACRLLGRRGILLTRFAEQIPAKLPPDVRHFDFIPFSQVFPRAAAVVHHGGIGTTAQALAAGVPQLVVPFAHDQPDNADRLKRMGVGDSLLPRKYRAAAVAGKLHRLITEPTVAASCKEVARRFDGARPLDEAAVVIEELGRSKELKNEN